MKSLKLIFIFVTLAFSSLMVANVIPKINNWKLLFQDTSNRVSDLHMVSAKLQSGINLTCFAMENANFAPIIYSYNHAVGTIKKIPSEGLPKSVVAIYALLYNKNLQTLYIAVGIDGIYKTYVYSYHLSGSLQNEAWHNTDPQGRDGVSSVATMDNGVLYMTGIDELNKKILLQKFAGSWSTIGKLDLPASYYGILSITASNQNAYICYTIYDEYTKKCLLCTYKHDGTNWASLGIAGYSKMNGQKPQLKVINDRLYLLYPSKNGRETISYYDQKDQKWKTPTYFQNISPPGHSCIEQQMVVTNNDLYIGYILCDSQTLHVKFFDINTGQWSDITPTEKSETPYPGKCLNLGKDNDGNVYLSFLAYPNPSSGNLTFFKRIH